MENPSLEFQAMVEILNLFDLEDEERDLAFERLYQEEEENQNAGN